MCEEEKERNGREPEKEKQGDTETDRQRERQREVERLRDRKKLMGRKIETEDSWGERDSHREKYLRKRHPLTSITDLPHILILSVYTDFLAFKFGKILIFFLKIW